MQVRTSLFFCCLAAVFLQVHLSPANPNQGKDNLSKPPSKSCNTKFDECNADCTTRYTDCECTIKTCQAKCVSNKEECLKQEKLDCSNTVCKRVEDCHKESDKQKCHREVAICNRFVEKCKCEKNCDSTCKTKEEKDICLSKCKDEFKGNRCNELITNCRKNCDDTKCKNNNFKDHDEFYACQKCHDACEKIHKCKPRQVCQEKCPGKCDHCKDKDCRENCEKECKLDCKNNKRHGHSDSSDSGSHERGPKKNRDHGNNKHSKNSHGSDSLEGECESCKHCHKQLPHCEKWCEDHKPEDKENCKEKCRSESKGCKNKHCKGSQNNSHGSQNKCEDECNLSCSKKEEYVKCKPADDHKCKDILSKCVNECKQKSCLKKNTCSETQKVCDKKCDDDLNTCNSKCGNDVKALAACKEANEKCKAKCSSSRSECEKIRCSEHCENSKGNKQCNEKCEKSHDPDCRRKCDDRINECKSKCSGYVSCKDRCSADCKDSDCKKTCLKTCKKPNKPEEHKELSVVLDGCTIKCCSKPQGNTMPIAGPTVCSEFSGCTISCNVKHGSHHSDSDDDDHHHGHSHHHSDSSDDHPEHKHRPKREVTIQVDSDSDSEDSLSADTRYASDSVFAPITP